MLVWQVLGVVNLATLLMYLLDYLGSLRNDFRFPNPLLLGSAALFGSGGAFVAMYALGHKLDQLEFKFGVPFLLVVHSIIIIGIINSMLW